MAEIAANIRDGITREIRFVEYKLRKRQTDRHKNKKKNKKQNSNMSSSSSSSSFRPPFRPELPDDVAKAMPSSLGEEDLQLKVALAISKEEAEAANKQAISDKLRLEMALKESAAIAESTEEKVKTAQTPSPTAAAPKDPWSAPSSSQEPWVAPAASQSTFDPFGAPSATANGFGSNDPWSAAAPAAPVAAAPVAHDPWAQPSSLRLSPPAPSPSKKTPSPSFDSAFDLFGDVSPSAVAPTAPAKDPWTAAPVAVATPSPSTSQAPFDPFGAPTEQGSPSAEFDPMSDFDALRISPSPQQAAAPHYNVNMNMLMVPIPASNTSTTLQPAQAETQEATASSQNGNNLDDLFGGLIDLTPKSPTRSGNPFDIKKPAPSLNELKSDGQPGGFDDFSTLHQQPSLQVSTAPVAAMAPPAAMSSYHGMMQMPTMFQPSMYGLHANNNNGYPPLAGIPQNQSLF